MIKTCPVCHHTGELTWRDGKYHCASCDNEISEKEPQVQPQFVAAAQNVVCPICKNGENNTFDGSRYRCALCGTPFDIAQRSKAPTYGQISGANWLQTQKIEELKKQKGRNLIAGIIFVFLFWPVSIYFFYKVYKTGKELKALEF